MYDRRGPAPGRKAFLFIGLEFSKIKNGHIGRGAGPIGANKNCFLDIALRQHIFSL